MTKSFLHHEMSRGASLAGVKRIRVHDLRHSHVSLLISMGFSAVAIENRVGHESVDVRAAFYVFAGKANDEDGYCVRNGVITGKLYASERKRRRTFSRDSDCRDEVASAYRDGEDMTEERKALENQTEEAISRFLNRDREELEFDVFCMLEEDGMTIEVMVYEVWYTFTCSMQGEIISVGRTDGERFGLRGK